MRPSLSLRVLACFICIAAGAGCAQSPPTVNVRMQLAFPKQSGKRPVPPAVLWLDAVPQGIRTPPPPVGRYTLLQKNRMFTPHLLVIPVGSVVQFPNADPFFHNVFSLFDGRRFDLGLYEAGSTKAVTFAHEGVSYIFCNIHPEMSAVVLTLSTNLFAVADPSGEFQISNVPAGNYELHVWIEGETQPELARMVRRIRLGPGAGDLGSLAITKLQHDPTNHLNMFGQPYDKDLKPAY
jgi:hypothetical protein